jgi:hypothetical protein
MGGQGCRFMLATAVRSHGNTRRRYPVLAAAVRRRPGNGRLVRPRRDEESRRGFCLAVPGPTRVGHRRAITRRAEWRLKIQSGNARRTRIVARNGLSEAKDVSGRRPPVDPGLLSRTRRGGSCAGRFASDTSSIRRVGVFEPPPIDTDVSERWSNHPRPTLVCQKGWFNHPPPGGCGVRLAGSDSSRRHRCLDPGWFGQGRADTDFSIPAGSDRITPTPRSRFWLVQTVRAGTATSILAGADRVASTPPSRFGLVQTARADIDTSARGGSDSPSWHSGVGVTCGDTARAGISVSARTGSDSPNWHLGVGVTCGDTARAGMAVSG